MMTSTGPAWLTATQAGTLLGVCTQTVVRLADEGRIGRLGLDKKCVRYRGDDVRAILTASYQPATVGPAASTMPLDAVLLGAMQA